MLDKTEIIESPPQLTAVIHLTVPKEVKPAGRMKPSMLPTGKVAHAVYHGPYENLGRAWGEFMKWIEAQGHTPKSDLWEVYVTGPESDPDPKTWRTEFYRPLN
jgi:effector-binding domain-containing protein